MFRDACRILHNLASPNPKASLTFKSSSHHTFSISALLPRSLGQGHGAHVLHRRLEWCLQGVCQFFVLFSVWGQSHAISLPSTLIPHPLEESADSQATSPAEWLRKLQETSHVGLSWSWESLAWGSMVLTTCWLLGQNCFCFFIF